MSLKLFVLAHQHPPMQRLISQALPVMDAYAARAGQLCHLGGMTEGAWGLSIWLGAHVDLLQTASGEVFLAFQNNEQRDYFWQQNQHIHTLENTQNTEQNASKNTAQNQQENAPQNPPTHPSDDYLNQIRAQGFTQRPSRQSFGVVDLSCPILAADASAMAAQLSLNAPA